MFVTLGVNNMTRRPVHVQASIRQRAAQLLLSRWDMGLVSHLGKKRQTGDLSLKGNMGNVSLSHSEWCCVNAGGVCIGEPGSWCRGCIASGDKHLWDCSQSQGAHTGVRPSPCPALGRDGGNVSSDSSPHHGSRCAGLWAVL